MGFRQVDLVGEPSAELVVASPDAADTDEEGISDFVLAILDHTGLRAISLAVPVTVRATSGERFTLGDEYVRV
jgi:hypothetical protein